MPEEVPEALQGIDGEGGEAQEAWHGQDEADGVRIANRVDFDDYSIDSESDSASEEEQEEAGAVGDAPIQWIKSEKNKDILIGRGSE